MSFCRRKIINILISALFFLIGAACLISSLVLNNDESLGNVSEILSEIAFLFAIIGFAMLALPPFCSSKFGGDKEEVNENESKKLLSSNVRNNIVAFHYATPMQV